MPIKGMEKFERAFDQAVRDRPAQMILDIHSKLQIDMVGLLAENTPKKHGHAARNWLSSIGSPGSTVIGEPGQGPVLDDGASAQIAEEVVRRTQEVLSGLEPYSLSYIYNQVEYVPYLNDGTDKIKPFAMIEKAVQAVLK